VRAVCACVRGVCAVCAVWVCVRACMLCVYVCVCVCVLCVCVCVRAVCACVCVCVTRVACMRHWRVCIRHTGHTPHWHQRVVYMVIEDIMRGPQGRRAPRTNSNPPRAVRGARIVIILGNTWLTYPFRHMYTRRPPSTQTALHVLWAGSAAISHTETDSLFSERKPNKMVNTRGALTYTTQNPTSHLVQTSQKLVVGSDHKSGLVYHFFPIPRPKICLGSKEGSGRQHTSVFVHTRWIKSGFNVQAHPIPPHPTPPHPCSHPTYRIV